MALIFLALINHYFSVVLAQITLDLAFVTEDGAGVPSRALVTSLRVGEPEARFWMMLDFNSSRIDINSCVASNSRFFDLSALDGESGCASDKVVFEEDGVEELRSRAIFRVAVCQHCAPGLFASSSAAAASALAPPPPLLLLPAPPIDNQRFSTNCVFGERCHGVLGLGRHSPLWEVWSAYTLTLHALYLGRSHRFVRLASLDDDDADEDNLLECSHSSSENICEFEASLGGFDVTVDFHTDDSFIWVPRHIYALYMAEKTLNDVAGAQRLFRHGDVERHRSRVLSIRDDDDDGGRDVHARASISADDDDDDSAHPLPRREVEAFREKLERARERAEDTSTYYRNSLHHEWFPLVFEPRGGSTATLVLDRELLIHSPGVTSTFGGVERSARESIFARDSFVNAESKMLLQPHSRADNRVSIGNGVLRRYVLHRDLLRRHMLVEMRVTTEHLSAFETLLGTLLFWFFVASLCDSIELLTPLSMCWQRACRTCPYVESKFASHRRVADHSFFQAGVFLFTLVSVPALLVRLTFYVTPGDESLLFTYAWCSVALNGLALLGVILYSISSHHDRRPPAGSYCWRSYRLASARFSTTEHLLLLGVLLLLFVIRVGQRFGNIVSAGVAFVMFANAVRHFYQTVRAGMAMRMVRYAERHEASAGGANSQRVDLPSHGADHLWLAFVLLVQLGANVVFTVPFIWQLILWPMIQVHRLVALLLVLGAFCGVVFVDKYVAAEVAAREAAARAAATAAAAAAAATATAATTTPTELRKNE
jgi:hypothetical protein